MFNPRFKSVGARRPSNSPFSASPSDVAGQGQRGWPGRRRSGRLRGSAPSVARATAWGPLRRARDRGGSRSAPVRSFTSIVCFPPTIRIWDCETAVQAGRRKGSRPQTSQLRPVSFLGSQNMSGNSSVERMVYRSVQIPWIVKDVPLLRDSEQCSKTGICTFLGQRTTVLEHRLRRLAGAGRRAFFVFSPIAGQGS